MYVSGRNVFIVLCAIASSCLCLVGGIVLIYEGSGDQEGGLWLVGIGLYAIGKAFFTGPMMIVVGLQQAGQLRDVVLQPATTR